MATEVIDWDRIEKFLGYGRRDAPVVFLGMEEGSSADPKSDLLRRSKYEQVQDMNAGPRHQPTWGKMSDFMLRRGGAEPTKTDRATYQATYLGRPSGETLIIELMPYPNKRSSLWDNIFVPRFITRKEYEEKLLDERVDLIRDLLAESQRSSVIGYGKAHWPNYRRIFPGAIWTDSGPFQVANLNGAKLVLSPHFASRAFNRQGPKLAELALQ